MAIVPKKLWSEEDGQGLSEYVLVLFLVSLLAVATMGSFAASVSRLYASSSAQAQAILRQRPVTGSLWGSASSVHATGFDSASANDTSPKTSRK